MNSCRTQAAQSPARPHLLKTAALQPEARPLQPWRHDCAASHLPMLQPCSERVALAELARRQPHLVPQRRCDPAPDRLYLAVGDVWPHPRYRLAVAQRPSAQRVECPLLLLAAKAPQVRARLRLKAREAAVAYHKTPGAVGAVQLPFPLSPALFCGALSARSSIC